MQNLNIHISKALANTTQYTPRKEVKTGFICEVNASPKVL